MKANLFLAASLLFSASLTSSFAATPEEAPATWVGNSAVNVNGTWYYCGTSFDWCSGGAFHQNNLGEISALYLGGQSQATANSNWNQGSTLTMSYQIDDGAVSTIDLTIYQWDQGEYGKNMVFQSGGSSFEDTFIDISSFEAGSTHTLSVWFHDRDKYYDSNFPNNYVAEFTKKAPTPLANSTDITEAMDAADGDPIDVQLNGLTLYKDTYWNTICLPFSLSQIEIETSPLAGAVINELLESTITDGALTLTFGSVSEITAGIPYIIKWTSNEDPVVDPIFTGVTLTTDQAGFVSGDFIFSGYFDPSSISGEEYLYLGNENTLYYPSEPVEVGPFRAYFVSSDVEGEIKAFVLNFDDDNEATAIQQISQPSTLNSHLTPYFTLDGRRLPSQPTTTGIYIHNGTKVIIK